MTNKEKQSGESNDFNVPDHAYKVFKDDPHKVEKLVKAGRNKLDRDGGSD